MDVAYACLALADLPGTHTTETPAVPTPAEFLLVKISMVETERRRGAGGRKGDRKEAKCADKWRPNKSGADVMDGCT